jgi:hypothetical protein
MGAGAVMAAADLGWLYTDVPDVITSDASEVGILVGTTGLAILSICSIVP